MYVLSPVILVRGISDDGAARGVFFKKVSGEYFMVLLSFAAVFTFMFFTATITSIFATVDMAEFFPGGYVGVHSQTEYFFAVMQTMLMFMLMLAAATGMNSLPGKIGEYYGIEADSGADA